MADLLDRLRTALADRYRVEREIGRGGMARVFGAALALTLAGCATPSEPGPRTPLAQHLVGAWDRVALGGMLIPGWVRTPGCGYGLACDSSYIAWGQLVFATGSVCSRTWADSSGQSPSGQRCRYEISGNEASILFEGNPVWFRLIVSRDPTTNDWANDLTLWGPPCDPWAVNCSQYSERYRKGTS